MRFLYLLIFAVLFSALTTAQNYITSTHADSQRIIQADGCDSTSNQNLFVFCSDDPNSGDLTAPGYGCSYNWYKFNESTGVFSPLNLYTKTITQLNSGGYKVYVECGGITECYTAWVFVNQTQIETSIYSSSDYYDYEYTGCAPFSLNANIDVVESIAFNTQNVSSFVINEHTRIEVCFTGEHTWVSDLGFYLVAPGYGICSGTNPVMPGDYGIVELLPSIAAWDQGITSLNANVLNCSMPSEIGTNCNNGDNFTEFCFTTDLPAGGNDVPCMCDLPAPLSGTFASAGSWSNIYGFNSASAGWSVHIYDCIGADVGQITEATIVFTDTTQQTEQTVTYLSGPLAANIPDVSCVGDIPGYNCFEQTGVLTNYITEAYWTNGINGPVIGNGAQANIWNIPSQETTYYLHVTDNFGCEKTDSLHFTPFLSNAEIITHSDYVCENSDIIILETVESGGTWSGPGLVNGTFNPAHPDVYYGYNWLTYSFDSNCPDSDSIYFYLSEEPEFTYLIDSCAIADSTYQVHFINLSWQNLTIQDAIGGSSISLGSNAGYSCPPIPANQPYGYIIHDSLGCYEYFVQGENACDCDKSAGTMLLSSIQLCESDTAYAQHQGNEILFQNDILEFIIHDGTGSYPYNALAIKDSPVFHPSEIPGFQSGQTYYIAAICGSIDTLNQNHADTSDQCFSQSPGVSVVWYSTPTAFAGQNMQTCGKIVQLNATDPLFGTGSWSCMNCIEPPVAINNTSFSDPDMNVLLGAGQDSYIFTWTVSIGSCNSSDNTLILAFEIPEPYLGEDRIICGLSDSIFADLSVTSSTYTWFDTAYITNPADYNIEVSVPAYGTYTFSMMETNVVCHGTDSVTITFVEEPSPIINFTQGNCGQRLDLFVENTAGNGFWTYDCFQCNLFFYPSQAYHDVLVEVISPVPQTDINLTWTESVTGAPDCSASDSYLVSYYNLPNANPGYSDSICGLSYELNAILQYGNYPSSSGEWNVLSELNPTGEVTWTPAGQTDPISDITVENYGLYYFTWTEYNPFNPDCYNTDTVSILFMNCNTVQEYSHSNGISLFPNPGEGIYTIEIDKPVSQSIDLYIFDIGNRLVYSNSILVHEGKIRHSFDITTFGKGLYRATLISDSAIDHIIFISE